MKPLFKDIDLQTQFDNDGFVLVDLLNQSEVQEFKDYYATLNNDHIPSYGFHVSVNNPDHNFVTSVLGTITSKMKKHADRIFFENKIITASYVVKEPNPIGLIPPHQDWSFTEEKTNFTVNVWTALVETDMQNGALGIIVGSHKFFDHPRASPAPQFKTPLDVNVFTLFPYLKLIEMKPGQALIFDSRTIHASPPNVSGATRLAVGFVATAADAPPRHYYLKPGSEAKQLLKYEANDYFFTHYTNDQLTELYNEGKTPEGMTLLETVENTAGEISAEALLEKVTQAGNTFNAELCEHLARLFNYNIDGSSNQSAGETKPAEQEKTIKATESTVNSIEAVDEPLVPETNVYADPSAPATQAYLEQPVLQPVYNIDNRTFFKKYAPLNILQEIKLRVFS